MKRTLAILLAVLGIALGLILHEIPARTGLVSNTAVTASAPGGDIAALTQRLERIESSLEALHSVVFLAGTGEGAAAAAKLSAETLITALRDEVQSQTIEDANEPQVDGAAVEAQPENAPALAAAQQRVEDALSTRRWTDEDAQSLRQNLASLSGRQESEVLARIVPALNSGEIDVVTSGPPF